MAELKTLKDLHCDERDCTNRHWLIQEAIKLIKNGTYMLRPMSSETKEFIKKFFNITEEDLK